MAKVICVDDDRSVAQVIAEVVQYLGHTPEVCLDSMSAVRALYDPNVRAILADYLLPKIDGIELLTIAQDRSPTIRRVLITAAPSEQAVVAAQKGGVAQLVIAKPPSISDIKLALAWM